MISGGNVASRARNKAIQNENRPSADSAPTPNSTGTDATGKPDCSRKTTRNRSAYPCWIRNCRTSFIVGRLVDTAHELLHRFHEQRQHEPQPDAESGHCAEQRGQGPRFVE